MRKTLTFILLLTLLTAVFTSIALSTDDPRLSIAKFDEYCSKWNTYYSKVNPRLNGGYYLSDDQQDVGMFIISYNEDHL